MVVESKVEYVIYDPETDTVLGRRDADAEWVPVSTKLSQARRWLVESNAKRHCYLDRFEVRPVSVVTQITVDML